MALKFDPTCASHLTFGEVAQRLKLSPRQFQVLLSRSGFPAAELTVGTNHVWTERTVREWLDNQPR